MEPRFEISPVAWVRSAFADPAQVPLEGAPAQIEVLPSFAAALDGVENATHLLVLAFLDRASRSVLRNRPKRLHPEAGERGVFATRSPARPNPIGVSAARLLGRDGLRLRVDRLDFADGTPVVDLKPYSPGLDLVFSAFHRRRSVPSAEGAARFAEILARELEQHLGPASADPPARLGMAAVFVAARALGVDPRDPRLEIGTGLLDGSADALIGLCGATFARGRLSAIATPGAPAFSFRLGERHLALFALEGAEAIAAGPPDRWAEAFRVEGPGGDP